MQLVGKVVIKVGGSQLNTMPGAKLNVGGTSRTPVVGATKVLGFSEAIKEPMIDCQVSLGKGQSLKSLDFADATVSFICDTGQVFAMNHAFVTEPFELTAAEGGQIPLKISAESCEEVTA